MNKWFRYKPVRSINEGLHFFRELGIRNTSLLIFSLFLNGSCYAQAKATGGFTLLSNNHCELRITNSSGNTLSLRYNTLPGNQSGQNHNSLWLWRASQVPWNTPPMRMQILPPNTTESGSWVLDSIGLAVFVSYIACYSVDSTSDQICACSTLGATTDSITNTSVDVALLDVSSNALTFRYSTLAGYKPKSYGNWFGLWKGETSPYNYYPPLASGSPIDDANVSTAAINNIQFEPGIPYTLVYFMGKEPATAAVIVTFMVQ